MRGEKQGGALQRRHLHAGGGASRHGCTAPVVPRMDCCALATSVCTVTAAADAVDASFASEGLSVAASISTGTCRPDVAATSVRRHAAIGMTSAGAGNRAERLRKVEVSEGRTSGALASCSLPPSCTDSENTSI